jgi:hypothetical protein
MAIPGSDVVVDPTIVYDQYNTTGSSVENFFLNENLPPGSAVTTVNGVAGPIINITGGSTGLAFSVGASPVILSGTTVAASGGTGQSSYAVGDILYASGTTALSKLADVATGNALLSGGVTTAPAWGKVGLTTHVTGVLPNANGGMVKINAAAVAPTVTDDSSAGYSVNSLWTDTVLQDGYMCMSAAVGAAIWKKITP